MKFLDKLKEFIQSISQDNRIPRSDKRIVIAFLVLIISPLDFIPDWNPGVGLIDDFIYIAFIFDYFFTVIDSTVLLSLFPWNMKAYARLKAIANGLKFLVPSIIKKKIWSYEADPY